jgi:hypothetical protein
VSATSTQQDQVADYLAAVRTHLADVSTPERAELLEDLEAHLREVAAEDDGPLAERIGSPESYAAELRASAGLGPTSSPRRAHGLDAARRRLAALQAHSWYGAVRNFLPELRPAWWVLRGWLLAYVLAWWVFKGDNPWSFPVPDFTRVLVVDLAITVALIVGSVALARTREPLPGLLGRGLVAAQVALVVLGLLTADSLRDRIDYQQAVGYAEAPRSEYSDYLLGPNGRITNIYPFDRTGRPLEGVLLYDGSGNPINLPEQDDLYGHRLRNDYPLDGNRREVRNAYPVPQRGAADGQEGEPLVAQPTPSVSVPPLAPSAAPTVPTPAGSSAPTPAPSAPTPAPSPSPLRSGTAAPSSP